MSKENQANALHCGEYKIRVPLKALLDDTQVKTLVAALQRSYDDGTAGGFDITSTGAVSVVTFYREMSDDLGVIQDNIARNALKSREPEAVVVEQLAYELADHQDESPIVQEIVTTMLERGAALLVEGDQAMVREEVGSVLKSGPQREMSNYIESQPQVQYVIRSMSESDIELDGDAGAFWSNVDGWGSFQAATLFSTKERMSFNLPMSAKLDAEWMLVEEARVLEANRKMKCNDDQRLEKLHALGFESESDYREHQRVLQSMKDMAAKQKTASIAAGSTAFSHREVQGNVCQSTVATKLVEVRLSALTRVEYMEVVEVPANITQAELDHLVNTRYRQVDGGEFTSDPEYWERGTCEAVESDMPNAVPSMMVFRTEHGLHIERADAVTQTVDSSGPTP